LPDIRDLAKLTFPFDDTSAPAGRLASEPTWSEEGFAEAGGRRFGSTKVLVISEDTFEAARQHLVQNSTAVLNFANQFNPGGGWKSGAGAQEENLFRRSNLYKHLTSRHVQYPLHEYGGIFSRDVCVFRGPESQGYPFLEQHFQVCVITAAAYCRPMIDHRTRQMYPQETEGTRRKIVSILRVAAVQGVEVLVLGAFGCGAFANPPEQVARLFHEALQLFPSIFKKVIFAIISRPDSPDQNFEVFRDVFSEQQRSTV